MFQRGFEHAPDRAFVLAEFEDVDRDVIERLVGEFVDGGFHAVVGVVLRADVLAPLFRVFMQEREVVFFDRARDGLAGEFAAEHAAGDAAAGHRVDLMRRIADEDDVSSHQSVDGRGAGHATGDSGQDGGVGKAAIDEFPQIPDRGFLLRGHAADTDPHVGHAISFREYPEIAHGRGLRSEMEFTDIVREIHVGDGHLRAGLHVPEMRGRVDARPFPHA